MNSRRRMPAAERLAHLRAALAEDCVRRAVDQRIDAAAAYFHIETEPPLSHRHFQRVIADFVRHVYEHGLRFSQRLSPREALGEAIAILDTSYPGSPGSRYDAAVVDASDSEQDGLAAVLAQLAVLIKERERRKYAQGVLATWLDPSDWHTNCEIAELQLRRVRPPGAERHAAWQYIDEIPALIAAELSADAQLRQLASAALHSLTL